MPALSRRYRREIIRLASQTKHVVLKNAVLSSFEMTETFLCFMIDNPIVVKSLDGKIGLQFGYSAPEFLIGDETELFWMLPFIRKIRVSFNLLHGFLQKLSNFSDLEVDLSWLVRDCTQDVTVWKLAVSASKVVMGLHMFLLIASKCGVLAKIDYLEIFFCGSVPYSEDCLHNMLKASALNVPSLKFDGVGGNIFINQFLTVLKKVNTKLNRTRSIAVVFEHLPDDAELLGMISNFQRIAPNLESIEMDFLNKCSGLIFDTEHWTQALAWYSQTRQVLCEQAAKNIKIGVTYNLSAFYLEMTPTDLQQISEEKIYDISQRYEKNLSIATVKNRRKKVAPKIELSLNIEFTTFK